MKYDYKIINSKIHLKSYNDSIFSMTSLEDSTKRIESKLNELGEQGRKLISATPSGVFTEYTFIREKQEN